MRVIANFTLQATLAAALATLAAASAAASADYYLKFDLGKGEVAGAAGGGQIEVHSFHWGPRQSTSADGSRTRSGNQVILDDTPGASAAKERQAGMKEMVAEREKDNAASGKLDAGMKQLEAKEKMGDARSGHAMLGASDRVTVGGAQTETAVIHEPPSPRDGGLGSESERTFVAPHVLERGNLTVKGTLPGCTVGQRYAGAQFAGGGMMYELKDVVISGCATDSLSLNYAKVKVRAWDPSKKE